MPAGSAYNVDAVLEVMIDGLRAEIDELRGVASQDHLRLLTEHRLVQIVGQAEVPGRVRSSG